MQFVRLSTTLLKDEESARNFLLVTLPHIHRFKKNFTDRLSNKPFLIRLLTTPPRLKYVASLACNLSWIACFLTLMFHDVVWQHRQSVVEFLTITLLQNYDGILQWKKWKSVKIYKTMAISLWPHFVGLPCLLASVTGHWSHPTGHLHPHRHARHDKTVLSVSRPLRRCELDSTQLKTVADRKFEVWTRSEESSNSHWHARQDTLCCVWRAVWIGR